MQDKTFAIIAAVALTAFLLVGVYGISQMPDSSLGADVNTFRTPTAGTASVGPDSSVTVVSANSARQYLVISTRESAVWLTYGSGTASLGSGELVAASSTKVFTYPNIYTGAITARAYSSTTIATVEQ